MLVEKIGTAPVQCNHCGARESSFLFSDKGYDLVRCNSCDLAYIANPPTEAELARIYSSQVSYHAELLDENHPHYRVQDKLAERHLKIVRKSVRKGRLLDVGCSNGQFLAHARASGFDVSGVELNQTTAKFARKKFGLDVTEGTLENLDAPDGSFDVITMFDVVEHVPDPSAVLADTFRLLAPGGWLIQSTPNIDGLFPRVSFKVAQKLGYWPHPEPPHHLFQFSTNTLAAMLRANGFVPGEVDYYGIALDYTFGTPKSLVRSPKRLGYACVFAPLALLGPAIGQGDWFYMAARKPEA